MRLGVRGVCISKTFASNVTVWCRRGRHALESDLCAHELFTLMAVSAEILDRVGRTLHGLFVVSAGAAILIVVAIGVMQLSSPR